MGIWISETKSWIGILMTLTQWPKHPFKLQVPSWSPFKSVSIGNNVKLICWQLLFRPVVKVSASFLISGSFRDMLICFSGMQGQFDSDNKMNFGPYNHLSKPRKKSTWCSICRIQWAIHIMPMRFLRQIMYLTGSNCNICFQPYYIIEDVFYHRRSVCPENRFQ